MIRLIAPLTQAPTQCCVHNLCPLISPTPPPHTYDCTSRGSRILCVSPVVSYLSDIAISVYKVPAHCTPYPTSSPLTSNPVPYPPTLLCIFPHPSPSPPVRLPPFSPLPRLYSLTTLPSPPVRLLHLSPLPLSPLPRSYSPTVLPSLPVRPPLSRRSLNHTP